MNRIIAILIAVLVALCAFAEDHRLLAPQMSYNGKYGYVNPSGKFMIRAKYDDARPFHRGFAMVEINGKWGFVNPQGRVVVPVKYQIVRDFNEGYAVVKRDGKWGAVNEKGVEEIPCEYETWEELYNLKVIRLTPEQIETLKQMGL